jgi:KUP system potassium uptake protein
LRLAVDQELLDRTVDVDEASYFLSHIAIVPTRKGGMTRWRKRLFLAMAHNAANPADYFGLPDDRTLTIGERIEF